MRKLGFAAPWINTITNMVRTISFSVLFNGSKLEEFKPSRGIRQGDPISPYLFLLAAEGLPCLLKSQNGSSHSAASRWLHRLRQWTTFYSRMIACCSSRRVLMELKLCHTFWILIAWPRAKGLIGTNHLFFPVKDARRLWEMQSRDAFRSLMSL